MVAAHLHSSLPLRICTVQRTRSHHTPPPSQALTPLTIGRPRFAAALLGALWGLGHSTGQMLIGLAFALLKEQFTDLVPLLSKCGRVAGWGKLELRWGLRSTLQPPPQHA